MTATPQKQILNRTPNREVYHKALQLGLSDLLSRVVASRTESTDDLEKIIFPKLQHLQPPSQLKNADLAAKLIADAIESEKLIVLATDYDTDGVTSAWVAFMALTEYFGVPKHRVEQVIGERKTGYGITDDVVNRILAIPQEIALVISADQGSSDEARIARLKDAGIPVCVTDHHQMPVEGVPASAACTVNPQQSGCEYDKTIAGCFVIFLVMAQVRQELIQRGVLASDAPSLKNLMKNVALGTVADSVSLKSINNRALVLAGLKQINQFSDAAWQAMRELNNNNDFDYDAEFLGFQVATRINAASRVSDVTTAYRFLTAGSSDEALMYLEQLDQDNNNRRQQQQEMLLEAKEHAQALYHPNRFSMAIRLQGNPGIQGIIASRIGERYGLPTVAMTEVEDNYLAGSGRGIIDGIDLRLAFQTISDQFPDMFKSFGGHSGAAGCMIRAQDFEQFQTSFEAAIQQQVGDTSPLPTIMTDGEIPPEYLTPQLIAELQKLEPYGREWPKPVFSGFFTLQNLRAVGQDRTHLTMDLLTQNDHLVKSIFFNAIESSQEAIPYAIGDHLHIAYVPALNNFRGQTTLQLRIETALKV